MKIKLVYGLFILFNLTYGQAQGEQGAIETPDGYLLYNNSSLNSHTLDLKGQIDLKSYPMILFEGRLFEQHVVYKDIFGTHEKETLLNYMAWEVEHIHKEVSDQATFDHEFIDEGSQNPLLNFWSYSIPNSLHLNIARTYFLDFIQKNSIYRLAYFSQSPQDKNAKSFLIALKSNMTFYQGYIDLKNLKREIARKSNS